MAGLLDDYQQYVQPTEDEKKNAQANMLAMIGAGLLGTRKGQFGQGLGQALASGLQGYQQQLAAIPDQRMKGMHAALFMQQAKKSQEDAKRQQENLDLLKGAITPLSGAQAISNGGPTPQNAASIGSTKGLSEYDKQRYIAQGGDPKLLESFVGAANIGKPEIKDYKEIRNPDGTVSYVGLDKFGGKTNTGLTPFVKPDTQNFGGYIGGIDPITGKVQKYGDVTLNQYQKDESARGWANVGLRKQEVEGQGKPPAGYRWKQDGTLEAIAGGPAEKAPTDAQSKALLFGARMQSANNTFDQLEKQGVTKSNLFSTSGYGVGNVVTALSSPDKQKLDQAKRDFVNATLRRESGAVISPSEFDNAEKQYFPQIGDSPEVIAQKRQNREIAMRGVQAEVPQSQRGQIDQIIGKKQLGGQDLFNAADAILQGK
jgi:hypothetical protein